MQQQIHARGSVRHAEKRRRGTCEFANRVARASLDAYERAVPETYRKANRQTCVAAIVAHFQSNNNCDESVDPAPRTVDDNLVVLGLGVGTKFLAHSMLVQEQAGYGKRIRDGHAEVLARRAFQRHIIEEMRNDLALDGRKNDDPMKIPPLVLERLDRGDEATKAAEIRYRLKPGVSLHFYASSAPCGNATLKKFVKMEKEKFDESLGPDEWPSDQVHSPLQAHSIRLGQFSLLVKKDSSSSSVEPPTAVAADEDNLRVSRQSKRRKAWPCRERDDWCPPSCSIVNFGMGTIHSCSDKLARWNCLGLQGSLLMTLIEEPMYMTTLTIGRKFSRATCQRAVCCRAEGYDAGVDKFAVNHPVLMETNVYMDESGTHDMSGVKSIGRDASFDSSMCYIWWPDSNAAECIDGTTGFLSSGNIGDSKSCEASDCQSTSECSTYKMTHVVLEVVRRCGTNQNVPPDKTKELTLSQLRELKRRVSPKYELAKSALFRHGTFDQWSLRQCQACES